MSTSIQNECYLQVISDTKPNDKELLPNSFAGIAKNAAIKDRGSCSTLKVNVC